MKVTDLTEARSHNHDIGKQKQIRSTNIMGIMRDIRKLPDVEEMVEMHGTARGMVAMVRMTNGDAYEIEIKPAHMGDNFQRQRGLDR